jgi:type II secretory pathway pseudopilin PulG
MTLLEVVITMAIMSILMSVFTAGAVQMYRSANQAEAMSAAQSQTQLVFERLDREIRYAFGISREDPPGGVEYVEYLTTTDGKDTCNQLRLDPATAQLQRRSWTRGMTPGGWTRIASNVSTPPGSRPFTFTAGDNFQSLQLHLLARPEGAAGRVVAETKVTFIALNTPRGADTSTVCTEGRGQ